MADASTKEEEYFPISQLPDRTLLHVFSFLDGQSRLRSECVCKKWWEFITFSQLERMPRFELDSFLVSLASNQWKTSFPPGYYKRMKLLNISLKLVDTEERRELLMNILEKLAVKQTAEVQGSEPLPLPSFILALPDYTKLQLISFSQTNFGEISEKFLIEFFEILRSLKHLHVDGCSKMACFTVAAMDALFSHGNLILLEFSSNSEDSNLSDEIFSILGKKCKTIQILIWRGAKNRIRPEMVWEFFRQLGLKFVEGPRSQLRLNFHFSNFDAEKFANFAPIAIRDQIENAHAIGNRMLQFQNGTRIDY